MRRRIGGTVRVWGSAVALVLAACGGGGAEGSADEFCDVLRAAEADQTDADASVEEIRQLAEAAPSELRDDMDTMVDAFEQIEALDEDDPDGFEAVAEVLFSTDFLEAAERLERFGVDECGLDPTGADLDDDLEFEIDTGADGGDNAGSGTATADPPVDGIITEAADVPDPLFDPFMDEELDLSVASYDGAQYFLDVNYTDAPWRTKLGSWYTSGVGSNIELGAGGVDVTETEAGEICDALAEYLRPFGDDGVIVVSTYPADGDGTFGDETELARGTAGEGC